MTVQEMFKLLHEYRDAVYEARIAPRGTCQRQNKERRMTHLEIEVSTYLPKFTPMHCRHCRYYTRECVSKNRPLGVDFCSFYEVEQAKKD